MDGEILVRQGMESETLDQEGDDLGLKYGQMLCICGISKTI